MDTFTSHATASRQRGGGVSIVITCMKHRCLGRVCLRPTSDKQWVPCALCHHQHHLECQNSLDSPRHARQAMWMQPTTVRRTRLLSQRPSQHESH